MLTHTSIFPSAEDPHLKLPVDSRCVTAAPGRCEPRRPLDAASCMQVHSTRLH
jgi:hypothetical protein